MRKMMLVVFVALAVAASGAPLCTDGTNNVLNLSPGGCQLGNMLFDNFSVSDNDPSTTYFVGINGTYSGGPNNLLRFTISPAFPALPGGVDIILAYRVSGGIRGVDIELGNFTGPVSVTETVCDEFPVGGICAGGHIITNLVANSLDPDKVAFFSNRDFVWIMKDINIPHDSSMSDFANSHSQGGVPEPLSLLLMGSGLLALGALRWRKKN